jgi:outer membrane protein assembly factor BamA
MKALSVMLLFLAAAAPSFAQTEPQTDSRPPVIRAIEYKGFEPVKAETILQRFKKEGIPLTVEHRLDEKEVVAAQKVLVDLLGENGRPGARVKSEVTAIPPRAVKVTFTAVAP